MTIKNGDFASFLESSTQPSKSAQPTQPNPTQQTTGSDLPEIFDGEAFAEMLMDEEKMEAYAAKMRADAEEQANLEPLSDEEFERQAMEAGGNDNNPNTPE